MGGKCFSVERLFIWFAKAIKFNNKCWDLLFGSVGTLDLYMFHSYQVVLMALFSWLVESPLMKAEWRSASMECGGQCVVIAGGPVMPEWSADN